MNNRNQALSDQVGSMTDCFLYEVKTVPCGWPIKALDMTRKCTKRIKDYVLCRKIYLFSGAPLLTPVFKLRVVQL